MLTTAAPPAPPRSVPLRASGFGPFFLLLFGAIWAGVGLLLLGVFAAAFASADRAPAAWGLLVVPLATVVVGAVLVLVGVFLGRPRRRVYREGVAARATVLAHRVTSARQNRRRVVEITYAFSAPSGARVEGRWATNDPPEVDAEIWILHDPDDPARSLPA
jgi:hypothetical protein